MLRSRPNISSSWVKLDSVSNTLKTSQLPVTSETQFDKEWSLVPLSQPENLRYKLFSRYPQLLMYWHRYNFAENSMNILICRGKDLRGVPFFFKHVRSSTMMRCKLCHQLPLRHLPNYTKLDWRTGIQKRAIDTKGSLIQRLATHGQPIHGWRVARGVGSAFYMFSEN